METKKFTFAQIMAHVTSKGATITEVVTAKCFCGCVKPNEIIAFTCTFRGVTFRASLQKVFDVQPVISIERDHNEIKVINYAQ